MTSFLSLHNAIDRYVNNGTTVAMEGFTHLIPFSAGHEIIRQHKRDLCLIRMTPDLIYDQLIGMGCARKLIFSWGGNPGVGILHRLRDAVENGWSIRFAPSLEQTLPPNETELGVLRNLHARTELAHTGKATPHA